MPKQNFLIYNILEKASPLKNKNKTFYFYNISQKNTNLFTLDIKDYSILKIAFMHCSQTFD